jgi:hypothetical protein
MQNALFNVVSESVTSNDYYTPKWLFDVLELQFDIDVCAPAQGIPWIPAKRWFSQADDGLAQDWGGAFVWMNPPYSQPAAWAEKFVENANGLALMPTARSDWFNFMWAKTDAVTIMPVKMEFERPNEKSKTIAFHTMLFAMGLKAVDSLHKSKLGKVR